VSLTRNVLVGVGVEVQPFVTKFDTVTMKNDDYDLVSCRSTIARNLQLAGAAARPRCRKCCRGRSPAL
jgi:hypothetical protein